MGATSPNYLNYVWTLVIYNGRYPLDGKTEEQNDCIWVLSEIYRGTDITLDRVPELLTQTCSLTPKYRLVLELALVLLLEECRSFRNQEVNPGSTVDEKCPDIKAEEAEPDPWLMEPFEFITDDGYSKKQDTSYSETAKFLSQTVPDAASAFTWHSFLDAAAWNKVDYSLYNATNTTMAIPATTFHPVVVNKMLQLYLTGHAPLPLAHLLYQYACYDCQYLGHWSCHNGQGSRWTPPDVPSTSNGSQLCTLCKEG
ncbi:hypothetical protein PISMIDRAFT_20012 [Pisolithus microcarpus 441]|uniref:Uncharacterized protein n=1 Tax=Pisolithus microcarpus 441 TaxID=765257 RepID=A0A0C9XF04_9AGAM|nr:hypothetical protein PISMIDRAFT_20012 [Pisolithus microcarpus 441]